FSLFTSSIAHLSLYSFPTRRSSDLIRDTDKVQFNFTGGIGAGVLYPKTNSTLMNKDRHDDFHISGYGISAKVGLNITFWKYIFRSEEHTSELQSRENLVCRLLLEKK